MNRNVFALSGARRSIILRGTTRSLGRALLVIVLVIGLPAAIEYEHWWESPRIVSALNLSVDQQDAIEAIYLKSLRERMACAANAKAAHEALDRAMDANAPEIEVEAVATRVAAADAARARTRAKMLYRMLRVLTAAQRQQLTELRQNRR